MRHVIANAESSMTEHGFYKFYQKMSTFLSKYRLNLIFKDESNEENYALTMQHLKIPFVIYLSLMAVAIIVFIIESIVHKIKRIHNQNSRRIAQSQ